MWNIYDKLIELIPDNQVVSDIKQTKRWTLLATETGIGSAMKFEEEAINLAQYIGQDLKEVGRLIKSWNNQEASIGLAAINSFVNQEQQVIKNFSNYYLTEIDALTQMTKLSHQKVGMIGHFPYIDRYPEMKKFITVFELSPRSGDLPSAATEFLLPEMDVVFITASTIINKTLPRLLELSKNAQVILVGSSCPITPILFEEGINQIGGTCYHGKLNDLIEKKETEKLPFSKLGKPILAMKNGEL